MLLLVELGTRVPHQTSFVKKKTTAAWLLGLRSKSPCGCSVFPPNLLPTPTNAHSLVLLLAFCHLTFHPGPFPRCPPLSNHSPLFPGWTIKLINSHMCHWSFNESSTSSETAFTKKKKKRSFITSNEKNCRLPKCWSEKKCRLCDRKVWWGRWEVGEGWYHLVAGSCNSSSKAFFCSS